LTDTIEVNRYKEGDVYLTFVAFIPGGMTAKPKTPIDPERRHPIPHEAKIYASSCRLVRSRHTSGCDSNRHENAGAANSSTGSDLQSFSPFKRIMRRADTVKQGASIHTSVCRVLCAEQL